METEDRLVIPAPLSALVFPLLLLGLAGTAIYYGVRTLPQAPTSPEYAALIPVGALLAVAGILAYRSSFRPLVLDKTADRILGYPHELSKVQKVVVREVGTRDNRSYAVELVLPTGNHRLGRAGWGNAQQSYDADHLAKRVAKFLNVPVETNMPFYASFSLSKGLHLTEEQARDAERAGVEVDPRAVK